MQTDPYQAALVALQRNNAGQALRYLTDVQCRRPEHWLLKAQIYFQLSESAKAITLLQQGLQHYPDSTQIRSTLAQLLSKQHAYQQIVDLFDLKNRLPDQAAATVLLDALLQLKLYQQATQLSQLLSSSQDKTFTWLRTKLLFATHQLPEAIVLLQQALGTYPTDLHFGYSLGHALKETGQLHQALQQYLSLYNHHSHHVEISYSIACTYYELNQYALCEKWLKQTLELAPNYVPAHESLDKLYWSQGNTEQMHSSYQLVMQRIQPHPDLQASYINQLLRSGQSEQAVDAAELALKTAPTEARFYHLKAVSLSQLKQDDLAFPWYIKAAEMTPDSARYQIDLANHYLQHADYKRAEQQLQKALPHHPDNQELWAYLGLVWRLAGDERHEWLNNYDKLVRVMELPVPPAFSRQQDFLFELTQYVRSLHRRQKRQPLDQSVRAGTQSEGHFLLNPNPLVQAFRQGVEHCIQQYLLSLPADITHPTCRRNTGHYQLNGSWSVQLGQGGFHSNHVHPAGWLSAPSYIEVPSSMHAADPNKSGWLKLGETCLDLGDREEIAREICPQAGQIILFPSYFWHGTYPVLSAEPRSTIPCDLWPVN
ncbi:2OG-Fe(II) oxygenase family protein [Rheinheimera marina]|uniref:2OG-Fe(II) oxygenase family protein n=1 Tax=Rheinheimera marina TaxID=1774958 RepID=A0ABV9JNX2_9GAMM